MDHRSALIILNMLPGIGPGRKRQLVTYFGSAEAALAASEEELQRVPGIGSRLAPTLHNWQDFCDLDSELRLLEQSGTTLITEEDDAYPPLLREIHDPPICLYVRGSLDALRNSAGAIAIVGSRHTTFYGQRMADSIAAAASYAGWPVVSGLARGIDTVAHEACLRAGGCAIAVIGSGLSYLYPQENVGLAMRITQAGGAVISEFPMRYRPDKRSFPMRNRIIAGIALGTIVVEAGLQSGSLITAAQALEQNRAVFAVPGQVDTPFARGCHALIKEGAKLIESFQDVIEDFTLLPGMKEETLDAKRPPVTTVKPRHELHLQGLERTLWTFLQEGEMSIDDLIVQSGQETSSVLAALLTLEMKHLVKQLPGKRVVKL
ncbi:MAG: DNA-protecting protein DprA [Lentisphaerae bacterium]|jgi:DNA processing protein|nr:DNA-protecting protein DprA [Lentisphaerota bacterium]